MATLQESLAIQTTYPDLSYAEAMRGLGADVADLPPGVAERLEVDGYAILPDVLDPASVRALREAIDALGANAAREGCLEHSTEDLALIDLVNKGPEFDRIWSNPLVLAAVASVLQRPFRLLWCNSREPLPGRGAFGLHTDWGTPRRAGECHHVCNSVWLLDDMCPENGATRLVPGSHRTVGLMRDHVADPTSPQPGEIAITAPAGSVVVFNSHCWHSGGRNVSGARRRALLAYYLARDNTDVNWTTHFQADRLRVTTAARLSPAQRWLLRA
jgi:ectoine hydroxylase-related dioxygenase (phytanoyl-CoA dioxygenase family)